MDRKTFFQKLKGKIQKNKYRERFLQELDDHIEDSVHEKVLKGISEKAAAEKTLTNLGDPEKVAKNYNVSTHYGSLITLYLEGLLFGILSLPLFMNSIMLSTLFPLGMTWHEIITKIFGLLLLGFILIGASYILYSFAFSRFFAAAKNRPNIYWLLYLATVLIPPLIVYSVILVFNWDGSVITVNPAMTLSYFIPPLATAFFAYHKNYEGILYLAERSLTKTTKPRSWLSLISFYFLMGYGLLLIFPNAFFGNSPYTNLVAPLLVLEFFVRVLGNLFFLLVPNHLGMMGGHWLMALLLSLISLLSIIKISSTVIKKGPSSKIWIHMGILSFIIPLLFLPRSSKIDITWQTPATEISYVIESQQNWPFYTFIKNYQTGIGDRFLHYEISSTDNNFFIEQDILENFTLSEIKDIKNYKLASTKPKVIPISGQEEKSLELPAGFACEENTKVKPPQNILTGDPLRILQEKSIYCTTLKYRDHRLYQVQNSSLYLIGIVVSTDKKWALLNISESSGFSAEELFLVKL